MMLSEGQVLDGRYTIEEMVGQGGMSYVYRAHDQKLDRTVAIKVLKEEYCDDEEFIKKFQNEAQAAARLNHPNIVAAYDVVDDREGKLHYIVMELVSGITLKEYVLRKGRLQNREVIGMALQLIDGLDHAHRMGVVHRDIKPQNIIVGEDGALKIADFGIARASTQQTVNASAMGSVHYISPEQARSGISDERSDIYSFGCTLYAMLCGKAPYDGDTPVAVVYAHMKHPVPHVREKEPEVYPALDLAVWKCMQKKPEFRYQHIEELGEDLRMAVEDPEGRFMLAGAAGDGGDAAAEQDFGEDAEDRFPDDAGLSDGGGAFHGEGDAPEHPADAGNAAAANSGNISSRESHSAPKNVDAPEEGEKPPEGTSPEHREDAGKGERQGELEAGDAAGGASETESIPVPTRVVAVICLLLIALILGFIAYQLYSYLREEAVLETESVEESSVEASTPVNITISALEAQIPGILGKTAEEAEEYLADYGVIISVEDQQFSDTYHEGLIMSYEEGQYAPGDLIPVTISRGAMLLRFYDEDDPSSLESLQESRFEDLQAELEEREIPYTFRYEASDTVPEGNVIRTNKPDTSESEPVLEIVVSSGVSEDLTRMPRLLGLSEQEAIGALRGSELVPGTISYEENAAEAGTVISQPLSEGTSCQKGTTISFTVSTGPGEETEEDDEEAGESDEDGETRDIEGEDEEGEREGREEIEAAGDPLDAEDAAEGENGKESGSGVLQGSDPQLVAVDEPGALPGGNWYGSINQSVTLPATGPGSEGMMLVSIRLRQDLDGESVYTTLQSARTYEMGSEIQILFSGIQGAQGVSSGVVEVVDAENDVIIASFPCQFSQR